MFNGIIFNQGIIKKINKRQKGIDIFIKSNLKLSKKNIGLSISCDGVCLTLINIKNKIMEFYLSRETIERSKFKFLKVNDIINLELPLKYGQKISGHICQGHIDCVASVSSIKKIDKSFLFTFLFDAIFIVRALSFAEIPVVIPFFASIEIVKAVLFLD